MECGASHVVNAHRLLRTRGDTTNQFTLTKKTMHSGRCSWSQKTAKSAFRATLPSPGEVITVKGVFTVKGI